MSRGWAGFFLVALIVGLLFAADLARLIPTHQQTITITDKQAVATNGHGGHKYLIYTRQGTFEDVDNLFHTKFSSSDLFGRLQRGHTYTCTVTGWRVPLFSWYPNLISCQAAL